MQEEDLGNRRTGFCCSASASYLTIWGEESEGLPATQEKHRSLDHIAWVDLRTQATENVLTAAVGADNAGPVKQPPSHAINEERETDAKSSIPTDAGGRKWAERRNGNYGGKKYVERKNL